MSEATADTTTAAPRPKLRLGDVLVEQQLISADQLTQALELQRATGKKLGRILIEANLITEEALAHVLARQLRAPFVNLKTFPLKTELVRLLPETPARRFRALVLEDRGDTLLVAMADPLDLFGFDELAKILKRRLAMAVVADSQLAAAYDKHYRRSDEISGLAKALEKDLGDAVDFGTLQASVGQEGAPVVRLLQSVFEDATRAGASDVHIEPQEGELLIRNRVDGLLQTLTQADKRIAPALAQRLKLMAGLDISEKRLPQDGRFTLRLSDRTLDVRLSTMPSQYGESVVMRLLGQGSALRRLEQIGMPDDMLKRFRELLGRDAGMILVTGPTGSGKTSTLYAALAELDSEKLKIITAEDPIEYRLPGLTQVQVNEKIELSFAKVLRAALRQDPDVILVGEMRDAETAEIGLRAAITGHLLLSTLHTKDTVSTPFRLLDMGAPPFMVATSLQAVLAQRLLRGVCKHCAEPHLATPQEQAWVNEVQALNGEAAGPVPSVKGRGCAECHGTGYQGRRGIYEMLELDPDMALAIQKSDAGAFLSAARRALKGKTLADRSLALVREGKTSLAEAVRISVDAE
ncbi:MAG: type II/IV secretion system protein [Proteobacteria bacterium]|nr:MSHA biogenesis protein MshE [Methylibium sp.]MBY0366571.1 GspE/PulE family protein [Burkholderiaceae bacterium]MCH8855781.1 type II/IV secretion system protein [Pseudomonadota bacterium]|mmetsp:Transcript_53137/g.124368  ORF Transcript_53137/g.124368 Transcript_53137/m.124368 type:complete len:579 (-) Transcript_53137:370-2106(-)